MPTTRGNLPPRGSIGGLKPFARSAPSKPAASPLTRNAAGSRARIIEDGPARTAVEAFFGYETSRLFLQYQIPKAGSEIGVVMRVIWNKKNLALPCFAPPERFLGQTALPAMTNHQAADAKLAPPRVAASLLSQDGARTDAYGFLMH